MSEELYMIIYFVLAAIIAWLGGFLCGINSEAAQKKWSGRK